MTNEQFREFVKMTKYRTVRSGSISQPYFGRTRWRTPYDVALVGTQHLLLTMTARTDAEKYGWSFVLNSSLSEARQLDCLLNTKRH